MSTVEFDVVQTPTGSGHKAPVAVLGGGPAGLTAGYLLAKQGVPVIVFEAADQVLGLEDDHGWASLHHLVPEVVDLLGLGEEGGVPAAPAHVADLLERKVPHLSARR